MIKVIPSIICTFFIVNLFSQYTIETEYIKAWSEPTGVYFNNNEFEVGGFETPVGESTNTFYAFDFWISGKNNGIDYADGTKFSQIVDSAGTNRFGPIMDSLYYGTEDNLWNRVWNISKEEIEYHNQNYGQTSYVMPEVIENWPAHGDTLKGQAFQLAPFYDQNNNGVYNPESGDYPSIIGDYAIFSMYNGERYNELKDPMGIEAHVMIYTYDCDEEAYQNTIFAYIKYHNRSNLDYDSTFIGFFSDFDIGNANDDDGKTDVNRSTVYAFNADTMDELSSSGPGYGNNIPVQSASILRGAKQNEDMLDNSIGITSTESINGFGFEDGIIDNEYRGLDYSIRVFNSVGPAECYDPFLSYQYYNLMTGYWNEGTPLTYGGNGYDPYNNLPKSRFIFSENDPSNYGTDGDTMTTEWWHSEYQGADIRMIGSSGPVSFEAGETIDMYMAFVHAQVGMSKDSSIALMKEYIDIVKEDFDSELAPCGSLVFTSINDEIKSNKNLFVYPNPFTDLVYYTYEGSDPNATMRVYDLVGHELMQASVKQGENQLNLDKFGGNAFIIKLIDQGTSYSQKLIRK